jgi:carbamoyl-phosphate synthase large subunit
LPAVGGEPTVAAIQALRADWSGAERLRIVGTDSDADKQAIVALDHFEVAPRRDSETYVPFLTELCQRQQVAVLWPNSTEEQLALASHYWQFTALGVRVLAPPMDAVKIFADKRQTYEVAAQLGIRVPRWYPVKNWQELCDAAAQLGYPAKAVVFRRAMGRGGIGLRIVTERDDLAHQLFEHQPDGKLMPLKALEQFIANSRLWPAAMVTEFLPGREFDVDCFCSEKGLEATVIRRNDEMIHGSSWRAETVARPDLADASRTLLESVGWRYIASVTFREDEHGLPALVEVNGRMPSSINLSWKAGCNFPLAALHMCLARAPIRFKPPQTGVRLVRFFGEAFRIP